MITNYTIATNFFAVEMSITLYPFPCFRLGFLTAPGPVKEESGVACRYRCSCRSSCWGEMFKLCMLLSENENRRDFGWSAWERIAKKLDALVVPVLRGGGTMRCQDSKCA